MNFTEEQEAHVQVMRAVLRGLQDTPLVLKGGTALLLCYELDRFSEDLDFDAPKKLNLESRMELSLQGVVENLKISRTKDTDTVQRYRIIYTKNGLEGRLKVEVSCRDAIQEAWTTSRSGIRTYCVSHLIRQKIGALEGRTTARDLYDVHFLVCHFRDQFGAESIDRLRLLLSDFDQMEGRFRPAFEEDDLFRARADLVSRLILEIHDALPSNV